MWWEITSETRLQKDWLPPCLPFFALCHTDFGGRWLPCYELPLGKAHGGKEVRETSDLWHRGTEVPSPKAYEELNPAYNYTQISDLQKL